MSSINIKSFHIFTVYDLRMEDAYYSHEIASASASLLRRKTVRRANEMRREDIKGTGKTVSLTSQTSFMLVESVDETFVNSTTSPDIRLARASLKSSPKFDSSCEWKRKKHSNNIKAYENENA